MTVVEGSLIAVRPVSRDTIRDPNEFVHRISSVNHFPLDVGRFLNDSLSTPVIPVKPNPTHHLGEVYGAPLILDAGTFGPNLKNITPVTRPFPVGYGGDKAAQIVEGDDMKHYMTVLTRMDSGPNTNLWVDAYQAHPLTVRDVHEILDSFQLPEDVYKTAFNTGILPAAVAIVNAQDELDRLYMAARAMFMDPMITHARPTFKDGGFTMYSPETGLPIFHRGPVELTLEFEREEPVILRADHMMVTVETFIPSTRGQGIFDNSRHYIGKVSLEEAQFLVSEAQKHNGTGRIY